MKFFIERLKFLRNQKNLTQKQLADALNMGERTIRRYESGETDPTSKALIKIADFFDVSLDYLVGRNDNIATPDDIATHHVAIEEYHRGEAININDIDWS